MKVQKANKMPNFTDALSHPEINVAVPKLLKHNTSDAFYNCITRLTNYP